MKASQQLLLDLRNFPILKVLIVWKDRENVLKVEAIFTSNEAERRNFGKSNIYVCIRIF
jgi:hypothetical protein